MSWIQRTINALFPESPCGMDCDLGAWFEVYYVSGYEIIPSYLVIVAPERYGMPQVIVRECDDRKLVIYRGPNYTAADQWLIEDEFSRVTGREFDSSYGTDDEWFEVWYEAGIDGTPCRLVVVTPEPRQTSKIQIVTPYPERMLFEASDYEDAAKWLKQNNLHQISGRQDLV